MNRLYKLAAYALYALGLVAFWLLAGSKYGWMEQMDPSISAADIEGGSDGRLIVSALFLLAMVASQGVLALRSANRGEQLVCILLIAIAAWAASRFA